MTRDPTFLGIASRFFPVATLMTELSGGFPRRETLFAQTDRQFDILLHKFALTLRLNSEFGCTLAAGS